MYVYENEITFLNVYMRPLLTGIIQAQLYKYI